MPNLGVLNGIGRQPQNLVDEAGNVIAGEMAVATGINVIAIGQNAQATFPQAVAVGSGTAVTAPRATFQGAIAIGSAAGLISGPRATQAGAVAIGSGDVAFAGASASGSNSVAVGTLCSAAGGSGLALGFGASSGGSPSVAIGTSSSASAQDSTALGPNAAATSIRATALGKRAQATTGTEAIAIGGGSSAATAPNATAQGAIAIGGSQTTGSRATAASAIAIGSGDASVVGASASAADAIALGRTASAAHARAVAIGQGVATTTVDQVNIGIKRLHLGVPTTAPADADLIASQASLWLDETGDLLSFKAKRAAGTVLSGSLSPTTHTHSTVTANRQTASYTLVLGDAGLVVEMNVASANNLTIPLNATVAFPVGTVIELYQYGAGQTTVVATGGVTLRSPGAKTKIAAQYGGASLRKIATDEWALEGNITT